MPLVFFNLSKKSAQIIIICVISVPSTPQLFRLTPYPFKLTAMAVARGSMAWLFGFILIPLGQGAW
ncbi:hypothetical protein DN752_11065 [Echinicola strongylocentroti]|uniref:Uncharacterized protein n=1 Tax=Echinicola strongylocentroti TaxID=1795355 RepID=A0A2Z4IIQ6_9BACT|nr:hypothetical protein DN752_11065 [Echinicola strongylocentroti]